MRIRITWECMKDCVHAFIPCFVTNAEILWGALCHRGWSGSPSAQGERRDGQRFVANFSLSFAYVIFVKMENFACHESRLQEMMLWWWWRERESRASSFREGCSWGLRFWEIRVNFTM